VKAKLSTELPVKLYNAPFEQQSRSSEVAQCGIWMRVSVPLLFLNG